MATTDFPTTAALAALRAWYEGLSARRAVALYFGHQRTTNTSSRRLLGQVRRRVVAYADARHRPDLAQPLSVAPAARIEHAQALAKCLEILPTLVLPQPLITDSLEQWFDARLAKSLRDADIHTFADLTLRVPRRRRWWVAIPGVGAASARRVEAFFAEYPELTKRARALIERDVERDIVPFEQINLPANLDGSNGLYRSPTGTCTLRATDDLEAVRAWLELHESSSTTRAYRKEAERLLLWATLERGVPLSSLTNEDAVAYRGFLRHPKPRAKWVGPTMPRQSSEWRPFKGDLSPRSVAYAISVLGAMFRWLVEQRYVLTNPFAGVKVRNAKHSADLDADKSFTEGEWSLLITVADSVEQRHGWTREAADRLRFLLDFCYATGLRIGEFVNAVLGDIKLQEGVWWLELVGKGGKRARVALPPLALSSMERYLESRGAAVLGSRRNPQAPLLAGLSGEAAGITAGRLWSVMRRFFRVAAEVVRAESPDIAEKFLAATPHWMRHTHATHALQKGVELTSVRDNLRHASIATTSAYLHTADARRASQLSGAFAAR